MSFNYQKHKNHSSNDSFWTSYSDLFLGLSCIFLLLYVTASLRTSTDAIKAEVSNRKLTMRVQDLENQLKMYDNIRKDYLDQSAAPSEAKEYRELMDKLTLLQEEAKDEKDKLRRQAMDNESKETALNKYQQMIRNVINANKLAKTKVINREDIIDEQTDEIDDKSQQVTKLSKDIQQREAVIKESERKIQMAQGDLEKQLGELKRARKQNQISAAIYEKRLAKTREEGQEKIDQLRDASERAEASLKDAKGKLGTLNGQVASLSGQLGSVNGQLAQTKGALAAKEGEASGLRGELAKAKAELDARRGIAREIKKGFAANGVKADIDMETGDVVINFGDHYFNSDSSNLKPEMEEIIKKAMPTYSKSLFSDPKVAKQISAVEVIGFASPTYKGRFVDPKSTKPEDRDALKYNMDLSYRRAKSIFNYVLSDKNVKFDHQREMLPLMKVSGRSFLEVFKDTRSVASGQEFCKVHDCKKAQRVIIRFNMERGK